MNRPIEITASYGFDGELVVDNFAGGGGASHGIQEALGGRPPDIAINHDARAIALHERNHPDTKHFVSDIWEVDPVEACGGKPVGLAWFSPDCTHFSRAKGDVPRSSGRRALAGVVNVWAKKVRPRVIVLENVAEFEGWGPLADDGRPDKTRAGESFRAWVNELRGYGYEVEWRNLVCADYGAPTIRKRLFLIARCDGKPIVWPEQTHGEERAHDWIPAHSIIDWTLPCPSIFTRARPLADGTMARIAEGVRRYVQGPNEPFIVRHGHWSHKTGVGLVKGAGAGTFRGQSLHAPVATVCATNDKNLVVPWIVKHYGGRNGHQVYGHDMHGTLGTITSRDSTSLAEAMIEPASQIGDGTDRGHDVFAFLAKYYGATKGQHQSMRDPLHTVRTKDCFALVEVHGQPYRIVDIGMRMLSPRELFRAQGFTDEFALDAAEGVKPFTKTELTRFAGNSVPPIMADALVSSQMMEAA